MFPLPVKITKQKKYRIASSELSARRVVDPGFLRKTGRFNRQAFWLTDHPTGCAFPVSQWPIGSVRPRSQQRLVCDGFSPSFLLTDTACLNQHGFCTCAPDTFFTPKPHPGVCQHQSRENIGKTHRDTGQLKKPQAISRPVD
jgi:hypothetical protein